MAGRRILAVGDFCRQAPLAFECDGGERIFSRRRFSRKAQTERGQIGNVQFHALGDVDKGVGAFIAIFFGVRRAADAEAVEDEKEGAAHLAMRSMTQGVARLGFPKT